MNVTLADSSSIPKLSNLFNQYRIFYGAKTDLQAATDFLKSRFKNKDSVILVAHENSKIEWVDGNIGSKLTMKYPSVILKGEGSHAEVISVAYSGKGQHQDAGAKIHHLASNTTSKILSKSISKDGGRVTYRGMVTVSKKAENITRDSFQRPTSALLFLH